MSRADELYIQTCRDILQNGVWDTDRETAACARIGKTARRRTPSKNSAL